MTRPVSRGAVCAMLVVLLAGGARADEAPLGLRETLLSALAHHPKVEAARYELDAASAEVNAARGNFDLTTYARGEIAPVGYYESAYGEVGISQPTTLRGAKLSAKYRNGSDFAVYDGKQVTSEGGEAVVEVLLPLLRDGSIDERRMDLVRARINEKIATESARLERAAVLATAARAWFDWTATGERRRIYDDLVQLAEQRRALLTFNAESGAIAPIEVTDNARLVASRRAQRMRTEAQFRRAEQRLSLYLRDAQGAPLTPPDARLPRGLPEPSQAGSAEATRFRQAARSAPELRMLSDSLELLSSEIGLAKNRALPKLDLSLFASQSFGAEREYASLSSSVTETRLGGKLELAFDVQRRKALGKRDALSSKRSAALEKQRFLAEFLDASIVALAQSLDAEAESARLHEEAVRHARTLADAEREELSLGQSSILEVNLREEAVLAAELGRLDALLGYHLAWVELLQLVGSDEVEQYLPQPTMHEATTSSSQPAER